MTAPIASSREMTALPLGLFKERLEGAGHFGVMRRSRLCRYD